MNAIVARRPPDPSTPEEFATCLQDYVPIKIARALTRELNRNSPYWEAEDLRQIPFLLAIQDFHGPGSLRMVVPATTEYVFGVRHSLVDGSRKIDRITEHRFGHSWAVSGFFLSARRGECQRRRRQPTGHHR